MSKYHGSLNQRRNEVTDAVSSVLEFGDFSLNFEVVYYMKTPNYDKYMDTQQEINFGIIEAFEAEDIVMPFPTQTIFLDKSK